MRLVWLIPSDLSEHTRKKGAACIESLSRQMSAPAPKSSLGWDKLILFKRGFRTLHREQWCCEAILGALQTASSKRGGNIVLLEMERSASMTTLLALVRSQGRMLYEASL